MLLQNTDCESGFFLLLLLLETGRAAVQETKKEPLRLFDLFVRQGLGKGRAPPVLQARFSDKHRCTFESKSPFKKKTISKEQNTKQKNTITERAVMKVYNEKNKDMLRGQKRYRSIRQKVSPRVNLHIRD